MDFSDCATATIFLHFMMDFHGGFLVHPTFGALVPDPQCPAAKQGRGPAWPAPKRKNDPRPPIPSPGIRELLRFGRPGFTSSFGGTHAGPPSSQRPGGH